MNAHIGLKIIKEKVTLKKYDAATNGTTVNVWNRSLIGFQLKR